jgi:hypothetical protein
VAEQVPLVRLQTSPEPHCASVVHGPQVFGVVAPQTLPAGFVAQSTFVQQSPGTQLQSVPLQSAVVDAAQQKSAELVVQAPALVQAADTHVPELAQTVPGP